MREEKQGVKIGRKIYEALLSCVHRNTSDDEFLDAMTFIIHKAVWEVTADNDKADEIEAIVTRGEPTVVDRNDIEKDSSGDA